jgi:hypothetical protein
MTLKYLFYSTFEAVSMFLLEMFQVDHYTWRPQVTQTLPFKNGLKYEYGRQSGSDPKVQEACQYVLLLFSPLSS